MQAVGDARGREEWYCQLLMQRILNWKQSDMQGGKMQATGVLKHIPAVCASSNHDERLLLVPIGVEYKSVLITIMCYMIRYDTLSV